jgi:hypothetical protein
MTPHVSVLVPVIGATYHHPTLGQFKVLRAVIAEWHIKWSTGRHEQVRMRKWKEMARDGMRRVA